MRCYFHADTQGNNGTAGDFGVVSFAIPDVGVIFRSLWKGTIYELQYAALLSLLDFVETNPKLFNGEPVEIMSDAAVIVYQLTKNGPVNKKLQPYYLMVQRYRSKIEFHLHWVPIDENPAYRGLCDLPSVRPSVPITYDVKDARRGKQHHGRAHLT